MSVAAGERADVRASRTDQGRVAVVGGGMSGLAAAFYLRRAGYDVELLERAAELGGRSASGQLGSRSVTFGGKNIGRRYGRFREFTRELGGQPYEPFGINSSRVDGGSIVTVDSSRKARSVQVLARQGRPTDFARLAYLAVRVRSNDENRFLGSRYFDSLAARYDARPLSARFGERFGARVLRPMTVRMNGAEPDEVFPGNFGTNLGMLLDSYDQLQNGLEPVLERFRELVPVRLETRAEALLADGGEVTGLRVRAADGEERDEGYDAVVLATPAGASADLVVPHDALLADLLRDVRYYPAAVALVEYEQPVFSADVRALVFDDGPLSNAGAYGMGDRHIVRYTFSGRAARPLIASDDAPERLLEEGEDRLARHFPAGAERRRHVAFQSWDAAYCGYVPFHFNFLAGVHHELARLPGLHLTGDYLRGASIEACFRAARDCATDVDRRLWGRVSPLRTLAI